ncbi:PREDICTED: 26S proteasome non-ATPase regulatory subunit 9 [Cyphomyrmex costatus]|uniref:26S proteasome non-ATPase regulatory subunit 9 n=1 Tax=Cyphomyrmex costatus TaxID=456900 RepID=A0A195CEP3_9HYME|nr:PREDICTED: 26S proteasome non-ATPase regulatory subunit 9 [Cyphomyrmex costatus]KYM99170.1 26S proteasome non-ATPase regulatory subunit 9 [Cyphomyrmex costatus]
MVVDMELQEAKDTVLQLMKEKDKIESDLRALKEILDSNHIGMDESLVDSEGYPRQNIDVYQVRHTRHKIICLTNDHKDLMRKIEDGLHRIHALAGASETEQSLSDMSDIQETEALEPFLRVNLVSPGSPAETAGIQVEDLILEFGSVHCRNFKSLTDIGKLVENSRYKTIHVKIKRGSNTIVLSLTPRPWVGKGLLGCNVIPVEVVER